MNSELITLSDPVKQEKKSQDIKAILDSQNKIDSQKIAETYPLESLTNQPFILWYSNDFVFKGSFEVNNLPGAEQYQAYAYVNSTDIELFLSSRKRSVQDIISGHYLMYVSVTHDINNIDPQFVSALFIKPPFELI